MAEEEQENLDLRVPGFGLTFHGKSQALLAILLMLSIGGGLGLYQLYHEAKAQERQDSTKKAAIETGAAIKELSETVKQQGRTLEAVVYVLTLSQAERDKLKLREPEKLRELQR